MTFSQPMSLIYSDWGSVLGAYIFLCVLKLWLNGHYVDTIKAYIYNVSAMFIKFDWLNAVCLVGSNGCDGCVYHILCTEISV